MKEEEGQKVFDSLKALHVANFPWIAEELEGMAEAAEVELEDLWILNMRLEILQAAEAAHPKKFSGGLLEDSCSDVLVSLARPGTKSRVYLAHNEDMTADTVKHAYFVKLVKESSPGQTPHSWLAFTYAGELPSPAFGMISTGISFALNAQFPLEPLQPGIARNFISRMMLEARTLEEFLAVITKPGQSCGHAYNIVDRHTGRIMTVEVGPNSANQIKELDTSGNDWYFHANSYKMLDIPQRHDNSSIHRMAVADTYQQPKSQNDMLFLLGDTTDPQWPIYRTGDSDVFTLCTVLFDIQTQQMYVLHGNPRRHDVAVYFSMTTLEPTGGDASAWGAWLGQTMTKLNPWRKSDGSDDVAGQGKLRFW